MIGAMPAFAAHRPPRDRATAALADHGSALPRPRSSDRHRRRDHPIGIAVAIIRSKTAAAGSM